MQISTLSGEKRGTGGGRMQVSTMSGGERGVGGGRMQVSTTSSSKRGTSGLRTQDKTMCGSKIKLDLQDGMQVYKWPVYISSALEPMECTLCSQL
jgi:hypothetical protein